MITEKVIKDSSCYVGGKRYRFDDASMSRIMEHAKNGMFIISAMRNGMPFGKKYADFTDTEKERYRNAIAITKRLERDLVEMGFGYVPSLGGYIEEDEKTGKNVDVDEFSFIVPKPKDMSYEEFVKKAAILMNKYGQNSVMVGGIPFIANGQIRYLTPEKVNEVNEFAEPDDTYKINPDMNFSNVKFYKEVDPEKRPYYTAPKKMGGKNFVFDEESKRIIGRTVAASNLQYQPKIF